ncbi:MAG: transcription antitermination factor NusB [Armatimonadota bacterium]|jgi:N utilization substance protein B|nr:transcription antitermination factor NusB [Armatimonadota bacterium]
MGTKSRRAARELALNVLYQVDVAKLPPEEALTTALANTDLEPASREFAETLVCGVLAHLDTIDAKLRELSVGWNLQRQPAVDRNILRVASFEICYLDCIPKGVSINEAVELAKKFSTEESGRFINGVLGALVRQMDNTEDKNAGADS